MDEHDDPDDPDDQGTHHVSGTTFQHNQTPKPPPSARAWLRGPC